MTLTTTTRDNLQQLLELMTAQGWLPHEVLLGGSWEHTPSIEGVLAQIAHCEPPVLRLMKGSFEKGFSAGIIRFRFDAGVAGLIDDHTVSHNFGATIEQVRHALSSASAQQGAAA